MLRYSKLLVNSVLLFTVPSITLYPQGNPPQVTFQVQKVNYEEKQTESSYVQSYDEIIRLLDEIESGELEKKCTPEELERITHYIAFLAEKGALPDNSEESLSLDEDIEDLLGIWRLPRGPIFLLQVPLKFLSLLVGLVGIAFFQERIMNPEMIFITIVKETFHPFLIGLILCAVFAASVNVMTSQILVLCSTFTEDVYKKIIRSKSSSKELLLVSRLATVVIACIAFGIAYFKIGSIYTLVLYAWSGLGASFGPLLIFLLYSRRGDQKIAWAGILSGGIVSACWPLLSLGISIDPIIAGFACSFIAIWIASWVSRESVQELAA